jgi:hypothetical protein
MPVRRRSRSSMAAMEARPEEPVLRRSSSSASMPGAMTPPSARVRGGSGTRVETMVVARSSRVSRLVADFVQKGLSWPARREVPFDSSPSTTRSGQAPRFRSARFGMTHFFLYPEMRRFADFRGGAGGRRRDARTSRGPALSREMRARRRSRSRMPWRARRSSSRRMRSWRAMSTAA